MSVGSHVLFAGTDQAFSKRLDYATPAELRQHLFEDHLATEQMLYIAAAMVPLGAIQTGCQIMLVSPSKIV